MPSAGVRLTSIATVMSISRTSRFSKARSPYGVIIRPTPISSILRSPIGLHHGLKLCRDRALDRSSGPMALIVLLRGTWDKPRCAPRSLSG